MKICFSGDLFLGGDLLNEDSGQKVTAKAFNEADLRIVNLEQPISDNPFVESKCTLYTGSYAVRQLNQMGVYAVNLANNHIQDKGLDGIDETCNHLSSGGIGYFGAGRSLLDAKKYKWLSENLVVLGYCEYDKSYLKQVAVADDELPGVNPLRIENILDDLNKLPENTKAVLHFHWGREHVWLPPYNDLCIARQLLEHDKVVLIVGMHAHRVQGYIEHRGKRAYMCLGNFLFPNFYIKPPAQIAYPEKVSNNVIATRQYHVVNDLTYKKWRYINRISLLVIFDSDNESVSHSIVVQDDNEPTVKDLGGVSSLVFGSIVWCLSQCYKLPKPMYLLLEGSTRLIVNFIWRVNIQLFHFRQLGFIEFSKRIKNRILKNGL